MPRYITRPKANDDWYERTLPALSHPVVYPSEPQYTGLRDADGNPISINCQTQSDL